MLNKAGIDTNVYKAHSTRAAASSAAARSIDIAQVLKTAGWSREQTFAKFYNKPSTYLLSCNPQEVSDLQEQLRDVMFYLEAQQKLAGGEGLGGVSKEELQESQVIVGAAASSSSTSSPQGAGGNSGKKSRRKPHR
ncbi:Brca1-associated protein-like [Plakobranchus ocellatus]|uniref:Brca1-associated protein-like n=1 Tax=Plakobranchus ocellatus TaxID=259542 RepID=A0AAV3YQG4_9GAST|nr:Brca1-associated protein-like [Plakobranchus ocellatus]